MQNVPNVVQTQHDNNSNPFVHIGSTIEGKIFYVIGSCTESDQKILSQCTQTVKINMDEDILHALENIDYAKTVEALVSGLKNGSINQDTLASLISILTIQTQEQFKLNEIRLKEVFAKYLNESL